MGLPVLQHPAFNITIPSTNLPKSFRPFTVGEEKILLNAAASDPASDDIGDILIALRQVIQNCCLDEINVDRLASFDIEYIFIKLRQYSVSDVVELEYKDDKGNVHKVEASLKDVKIDIKERSKNITLSEKDNIAMKLGFPTFKSMVHIETSTVPQGEEAVLSISSVIKIIVSGDEVFDTENYSDAEMQVFTESLSMQQVKAVTDWVNDMPYVYIDVTLPDGTIQRIKDLPNFFD